MKNILTDSGAPPIYYAAQEGRLEVLKFMSEKCNFDLSKGCSDGMKPIHAASQCGHTNIVKVRIINRKHAKFYLIIMLLFPPQYIVSQTGNQSIFEFAPDGATPLHFATGTQ